MSLSAILTRISTDLERESAVKEAIRESLQPIDTISRAVTSSSNRAHSTSAQELAPLAEDVQRQISQVRSLWLNVVDKIPAGEVYKYAFATGPLLRSLTTTTVLAHFLLHDDLATIEQVQSQLGLEATWADKLQLTPDDYLQGVIGCSNELARLALNAVTMRNFELPLRIATFEKDLFAGFSLVSERSLSCFFVFGRLVADAFSRAVKSPQRRPSTTIRLVKIRRQTM